MPRRRPRPSRPLPPLPSFRTTSNEFGPDGEEEYVVVSVPGVKATKVYRCPGCDHEIRIGEPHVVAWPAADAAAGERRHWHRSCWHARSRRGPTRRR